MSDLLNAWNEKTLTVDMVKTWITQQGLGKRLMEAGLLPDEELNHVAHCIHHIYLWYHGGHGLGHFLTAVLKNNLKEACGRADSTNILVLPLYVIYLYNHAPRNYKDKAKLLD